ncbi:MAG: hypothetical protein VYA39_00075, partial [Candidatus Thermoplasmatota archaeon]|nr:hypothetical protein [Candidatus Thermoplasmatota archaeon]
PVLGKSKGSNAGSGERRNSEGERQQGREPSNDEFESSLMGLNPFDENEEQRYIKFVMGAFQPPDETTTSSSFVSFLIIDVWGTIVPLWTASTVDGAMPNFSSTSLTEIGSIDSTLECSPRYSTWIIIAS